MSMCLHAPLSYSFEASRLEILSLAAFPKQRLLIYHFIISSAQSIIICVLFRLLLHNSLLIETLFCSS